MTQTCKVCNTTVFPLLTENKPFRFCPECGKMYDGETGDKDNTQELLRAREITKTFRRAIEATDEPRTYIKNKIDA